MDISIVIPSFNEAGRLPRFLDRVIAYCNNSQNKYEIIVVDDGSYDATYQVAMSYKPKFSNFYVLKFDKNRGKGCAVKAGFMMAKGEICLFLDADGSVGPEEIEKNLHFITEENYDIFIGSRVIRDESSTLGVKWYRRIMGMAFNSLVHLLLFRDIKDTQCGFKMFKKKAINPIFSRNYICGFGFDIEILYIAKKLNYRIKEGSVSWRHIGGSKFSLIGDPMPMFFDIFQVRLTHSAPVNLSIKYMGLDEYKHIYDLEEDYWWFASRRNLVSHLIKLLGVSSPSILDAGSGTGLNLLSFGKLGKTFGLDASNQAIEFCTRRDLKNIAQCEIENICDKEKTFDIITCLDTLEHIENPVRALSELSKVLKDDGKLILAVPAFKALWSQHDDISCHFRRYSKKLLLYDLNDAGLKSEKMGYFFFTSFFAIAAMRIIKKLLLSKKKIQSDIAISLPRPLNKILKFLFRMEMKVFQHVGLPFGTTLYAVVSKKDLVLDSSVMAASYKSSGSKEDYDVSIIIACYNEENLLENNIKEIQKVMDSTIYSYELVFVDDKSKDKTRDVIIRITKDKSNMQYAFHRKNIGRGGTVSDGIRISRGKIVGFLDIDLEVDAVYIPSMVQAINRGYDVVTGFRFYRISLHPTSFTRHVLSVLYRRFMRVLLSVPIEDSETGYKFFNRKKILPLIEKTKNKGWFWDTEIMALAFYTGLRINEIPCLFIRKPQKKTEVRLIKDTIDYFIALWKFRLEMGAGENRGVLYSSTLMYRFFMKLAYGQNFESRYEAIAEHIPQGVSVIDVCCGDCYLYHKYLKFKDVKYLGLDVNTAFVSNALKKKLNVRLFDINVDTIPTAEYIIMQSSLYQFIPDEKLILEKLFRSATKAVIVAEPIRNLSTSDNLFIASIAKTIGRLITGSTAMRFNEQSLTKLFNTYGEQLKSKFQTKGGRELVAIFEPKK